MHEWQKPEEYVGMQYSTEEVEGFRREIVRLKEEKKILEERVRRLNKEIQLKHMLSLKDHLL